MGENRERTRQADFEAYWKSTGLTKDCYRAVIYNAWMNGRESGLEYAIKKFKGNTRGI